MIAKISEFVKGLANWAKANTHTILLAAIVVLLVLFSFTCGYIIAKYQDIKPIQIQ